MKLFFLLLVFFELSLALTLEEALSIARSNATKVKLSLLDIQKAQQKIRQARSAILPHVSFSYFFTHLDDDLRSIPRDRHSYSLEVNQTVFNLQTLKAIDLAKENLELQKLIHEDVLREIEYQTQILFYGLLYKKKVIKVYEENLRYWEENYKLVQEKYKLGVIPKVELLRSQAQFESAKAQLESAKIDFLNALENFKAFLNVDYIQDVEGELDYRPYMIQVDFKDLLLKNNTTLKVAKKLVELQEKDLEQLKAQYYPKVNAFVKYQGSTSRVGSSNKMVDGYSLGLSLNYDIFDGFARESTIAQSNIEILKQKENLLDTQRNLLSKLSTTLNTLKSLQTQIQAIEVSLKAAEESLRLSKERYKLGIATQLEVLEAVSNYNNIVLNLYYLYYQHNSQLALLERLVK